VSQLITVLRWRWRAGWNQVVGNGRSQIALLFFLSLNVGLLVWGRRVLARQLSGLSGDELTNQIWLILVGLLVAIALFALLRTAQTCLANPETALLLTQPLSPKSYWWISFGEVFGTAVLPWLIVWTGLLYWVLSSLEGVTAWWWCGWLFSAALLLTAVVMVTMAALLSQRWAGLLFTLVGMVCLISGPWVNVATALVLNLFVLVGFFFVAHFGGNLLADAYREAAKFTGGQSRLKLPERYSPAHWLLRWRTPFAALVVRELRSQSRNWLSWGRLVALGVYLTFLPTLQRFLQGLDASLEVQIIIPAVLFGLGLVLEYAPYAFSGEGNRFTLWLVAPLKLRTILNGRLFIYLLPALAGAFGLSSILAWQMKLTLIELGRVTAVIILFLLLIQLIYVWVSSWDLDLNLSAEGFIQTLLIEEAPINPKRLLLVACGLIVVVGICWSLLQFDLTTVILWLLLLNGISLFLGSRLARKQLEP